MIVRSASEATLKNICKKRNLPPFSLAWRQVNNFIIDIINKVWWLCLVLTSTIRFAGDVGYKMAKSWYGYTRNCLYYSTRVDLYSHKILLLQVFVMIARTAANHPNWPPKVHTQWGRRGRSVRRHRLRIHPGRIMGNRHVLWKLPPCVQPQPRQQGQVRGGET